MGTSQFVPILLNLAAAILGAVGQWLYKIGGLRMNSVPIYKNWHLFSGMALFCIVMVLFIASFRLGGRLSVVYPVYATTFIWGMLIAIFLDKEPWAWGQMAGIAFIILGVGFIAAYSPK